MSDPVRQGDGPNEENEDTHRENELRWEYDLPLVTNEERRQRVREYMDEKYGYDIDS